MDIQDRDDEFLGSRKSPGDSVSSKLIRCAWAIVFGMVAAMLGDWVFVWIYSHYSIKNTGFHFPDREPAKYISEERPPYYVCLYKEEGRWRWVIYKHEQPKGVAVGGGATESYHLSRNIALTCVIEDRKR